jgi:hypothetical protein
MEKLLNELDVLLKQVNEKANEIIDEASELKIELDRKQEEFDDYKCYVADNYEEISPYKMYCVSESDFH